MLVLDLIQQILNLIIKAIYDTLKQYKHSQINADKWLSELKTNYREYYSENLEI